MSASPKGPFHDFYGGPLSNFAYSPVTFQHPFDPDHNATYPTVENMYQAWKATNALDHDRIATEPNTWTAKMLGNRIQLRGDWEEVKYEVMLAGLREKFKIPVYREALLATGDDWIREDSPTDFIWGYRNGGLNLLGLALMVVRDELAVE